MNIQLLQRAQEIGQILHVDYGWPAMLAVMVSCLIACILLYGISTIGWMFIHALSRILKDIAVSKTESHEY